MSLFDRFKQVKAFVFGIEGVCIANKVLISDRGDRWFTFHSHDRYALQSAVPHYPIAIVGNGHAPGETQWLGEVGVTDLFVDSSDKSKLLGDWVAGKGLKADEVLGMGSDLTDLGALGAAGFRTCPADAVDDIKADAAYISHCNGGAGAIRDVIEKVMKLQGIWNGERNLKRH